MGSGGSKINDTAPVWKPLTGSLADDLATIYGTAETDASRSKAIETEIQKRIAAELHRVRTAADAAARDILPDLLEHLSAPSTDSQSTSRHQVARQVALLRTRLENQQSRRERAVPAAVETARQDVARCLREQDRTPLNCWHEADVFRREVAKLEREWVDKTA